MLVINIIKKYVKEKKKKRKKEKKKKRMLYYCNGQFEQYGQFEKRNNKIGDAFYALNKLRKNREQTIH